MKLRTYLMVIGSAALFVAVTGMLFPQERPETLTQQDREAIVATALDYVDGFYEGNPERMARALHPEVAKRTIITDSESGEQTLRIVDAAHLVSVTEAGVGVNIARDEGRRSDVMILDAFGDIASVRVDAITWVDYLHVGKVNGEWKIINVLWGWRD